MFILDGPGAASGPGAPKTPNPVPSFANGNARKIISDAADGNKAATNKDGFTGTAPNTGTTQTSGTTQLQGTLQSLSASIAKLEALAKSTTDETTKVGLEKTIIDLKRQATTIKELLSQTEPKKAPEPAPNTKQATPAQAEKYTMSKEEKEAFEKAEKTLKQIDKLAGSASNFYQMLGLQLAKLKVAQNLSNSFNENDLFKNMVETIKAEIGRTKEMAKESQAAFKDLVR